MVEQFVMGKKNFKKKNNSVFAIERLFDRTGTYYLYYHILRGDYNIPPLTFTAGTCSLRIFGV